MPKVQFQSGILYAITNPVISKNYMCKETMNVNPDEHCIVMHSLKIVLKNVESNSSIMGETYNSDYA